MLPMAMSAPLLDSLYFSPRDLADDRPWAEHYVADERESDRFA